MEQQRLPSPPPRPDPQMARYLIVLVAIGVAGIIVADAVADGDSTALVGQIALMIGPAVGVLIAAVKGGEAVKAIKGDTEQIREAVNGKLDARFAAMEARINARIDALMDEMRGQRRQP